jgi:hypothetical protein
MSSSEFRVIYNSIMAEVVNVVEEDKHAAVWRLLSDMAKLVSLNDLPPNEQMKPLPRVVAEELRTHYIWDTNVTEKNLENLPQEDLEVYDET